MQRRHPLACSISRSLCFKYARCVPARRVGDLRADPEEIFPNAEEEFPNLDGMHLFRDFCMTTRQDNSTNTTSYVPFEAARNISIKAAFWPNAATDVDSELPQCALRDVPVRISICSSQAPASAERRSRAGPIRSFSSALVCAISLESD